MSLKRPFPLLDLLPRVSSPTHRSAGRVDSSLIASRLIGLVCGISFAVLAISSITDKSATFDETAHLPAGILELLAGDYAWNVEHPPFVKLLAAVPCLGWVHCPDLQPVNDWADAQSFLFSHTNADHVLFAGRLAVLPLALLLGVIIYLWAENVFGPVAACLALFLYVFEPNVIAHSRLITTDIGAACFFCSTVYVFYLLIQRITIARVVIGGISLGLAFVTKYSTLLLIPILVALALIVSWSPQSLSVACVRRTPREARTFWQKLLCLSLVLFFMGILAYVTLWATYRFQYDAITLPGQVFPHSWDSLTLGGGFGLSLLSFAKEHHLFPEAYLHGLAHVQALGLRRSFFLGEITYGHWSYFIVTFVLKTPLPLIFLLVLALAVSPQTFKKRAVALAFLVVPPACYFVAASASYFNIGHRHILPIYPFLFVLTASLVQWRPIRLRGVQVGLAALLGWYLYGVLAIFPHYLAYFNETVGGPDNGYRYLGNSNLDWGQDLKGLKRYMQVHHIDRVWLSYHGTAPPHYYGISYNALPSYLFTYVTKNPKPTPYVAVSVSCLQGTYLGLRAQTLAFLHDLEPLDKIGYSIFIYKLD